MESSDTKQPVQEEAEPPESGFSGAWRVTHAGIFTGSRGSCSPFSRPTSPSFSFLMELKPQSRGAHARPGAVGKGMLSPPLASQCLGSPDRCAQGRSLLLAKAPNSPSLNATVPIWTGAPHPRLLCQHLKMEAQCL